MTDELSKGQYGRQKTPNSPKSVKTDRNSARPRRKGHRRRPPQRYAALDLGTNNCRLLIAAPRGRNIRIVDAFSKIVRLGENLSRTGALSEAAMDRTIEVLKICAEKIHYRGVTHLRCVATQACRGATNGKEFLARVKRETGLTLEMIGPEEEARLAMLGCRDLFDPAAEIALVFDIGGGSTELAWVRLGQPETNNDDNRDDENEYQSRNRREPLYPTATIKEWSSLPFGVVSLAEKWNGREIDRPTYEAIIASVRDSLSALDHTHHLRSFFDGKRAHLLGTSGTVTSLAGVQLELTRYRRTDVDGQWMSRQMVSNTSEKLRAMSFDQRAKEPCIGPERADLVVCGCAILEAILHEWPADRIRVADRGLREGILSELSNGRRMAGPGQS